MQVKILVKANDIIIYKIKLLIKFLIYSNSNQNSASVWMEITISRYILNYLCMGNSRENKISVQLASNSGV